MPNDPYTRAARALSEPAGGKRKPKERLNYAPKSEERDQVVGKKYMDQQSLEDEAYMSGAQQRINRRLSRGAERVSEEVHKRKGFGLKRG